MDAYEKAIVDATLEFPKFRIVAKSDSSLMRVIDFLLKVITFWKMTEFMYCFTTTLGYTVYTSTSWDQRSEASRITTLKHELVHMRQMERYGRILFSLAFLLFWLPIGLAYFRKKFEQEAYEESMRWRLKFFGIHNIENPDYKESIVCHFLSAEYVWTWPFRSSIEKWFDATVEKLKAEALDD